MVGIFRKNEIINVLLLLPYTAILRISSLIHPRGYEVKEEDTFFVHWFFGIVSSPFIQSLLGVVFVFLQAVMINLLVNDHRLHRLPSALTGMIYILLISSLPELQVISPSLIGTTFVLIAMREIFKTYKMTEASKSISNAAFCSALAAMIYPPYIFTIVAGFVGLTMMRNFSLLERLQYIIGYGVLFWIAGSALYFFDLLDWSFWRSIDFPGIISAIDITDLRTQIILGHLVVMILISLFNYYNFMKKKGIDIRKKIDFFYWILLCSLLCTFFFPIIALDQLHFVVIPLAFFISMVFLMMKNHAFAELIHISLVVGIFYIQFA